MIIYDTLHEVAGTDYKPEEVYRDKRGRDYFIHDKFFHDDTLIGFVDRDAKELTIRYNYEEYTGGITGLAYATRELKDAFKHYKVVRLMAFSYSEMMEIFKAYKGRVKAGLNVTSCRGYKRSYESLKVFAVNTDEEDDELYKTAKEHLEKLKQKRKAKEEAKRKEKEEDLKAEYEYTLKIFNRYLKDKGIEDFSESGLIMLFTHDAKYYRDYGLTVLVSEEELKEIVKIQKASRHGWRYAGTGDNYEGRWVDNEYVYTRNSNHASIKITLPFLKRYLNISDGYDIMFIDSEGAFRTSRGVRVEDSKGLVKKLLKRFVNTKTANEKQKFIGLHVGSFEILEWNDDDQYLQVGCHRFQLEHLKKLAETLKGK